ncbi:MULTISPECIES: hypothetical protein [unclassified Saccharothrix]|uniref:hypothetical protein n=1 Tax=unclassified Saccharothrix TaxID=2593673 RepID=UPI00307CD17E
MSENCPNGRAWQDGWYYPDPPGDGGGLRKYAKDECFGGRAGTTWRYKHAIIPVPGDPWDPDAKE